MDIVHVFKKTRATFGSSKTFSVQSSEMMFDVPPNRADELIWTSKTFDNKAIQSVPELSEHNANTERVEHAETGMHHVEGGWPREINYAELDQTSRYRKKVERMSTFQQSSARLGKIASRFIEENNALDVEEHYFEEVEPDISNEPPSLTTLSVLRDPSGKERWARDISWRTDGGTKLAVAYAVMDFLEPSTLQQDPVSYIWDIESPNFPFMELIAPSPLCCLQYAEKEPELIVAGCYNGLISFFDCRKGPQPVACSKIESSHKDPVYGVQFLKSKGSNEVFSTSTDGQVLWWDVRKLSEPSDTLWLKISKAQNQSGGRQAGSRPGSANKPRKKAGAEKKETDEDKITLGGTLIEYDVNAGVSKFLIGTEQGRILNCNRKSRNANEMITSTYIAHTAPVRSLNRNPFFPKYYLSVGDWTVKLWNEEISQPVHVSPFQNSEMTQGLWSPSRAGIFCTANASGYLSVWDLCLNGEHPIYSTKVTSSHISKLAFHEEARLLTVGDKAGGVYVVKFGDSLVVSHPSEKAAVSTVLEREYKREKNLELRNKEAVLKKQRDERLAAKGVSNESKDSVYETDEQLIASVSEEFDRMVQ